MPTTSRLFNTDPWKGPKLKGRNLSPDLLAIKPKNCKVIIRRKKALRKKHGTYVLGIHLNKGKHHTILIPPSAEKETIAHEFGHAALKHQSQAKRSAPDQIIRELGANRWAYEHWAKPNNVKTGIFKERKRWIEDVAAQTMYYEESDIDSTLQAVQNQMKRLKMEPLSNDEKTWIIKWMKKEQGYFRKTGWEPKYSLYRTIEKR